MSETDSTARGRAADATTTEPARRSGTARRAARGVKNGLTASFQNSVLLKGAAIVAEVALLAVALGLGFEPNDPGLWLSFGLGSLALFNFILFYQSDEGDQPGAVRETRSAAMRRAIAGSAVTTYLLLVALLAFNPTLQESAGSNIGCGPPSTAVMLLPLPEPDPDPAQAPADSADADAEGDGISDEAASTEEDSAAETATVAADPVAVSVPSETCIGVSRDLINRLGVVVGTIAVFYFGTTTLEDLVRERMNKPDPAATDTDKPQS